MLGARVFGEFGDDPDALTTAAEAFGPKCNSTRYANGPRPTVTAWCPGRPTPSRTSELAQRAGWLAAEQLVKDGKAGGIVLARLDRLARNVLRARAVVAQHPPPRRVVMSARESETSCCRASQRTT